MTNVLETKAGERDCDNCKHYKYDANRDCWACSVWDCEYTPEGDYVEES